MRYVILGGSIAGLSAARAIRETDRAGEIVIVTAEAGKPYYRPLIPMLIDGSKQQSDLEMPDDPYHQLAVNVSVRTAEKVDTKRKTVFLKGNKKLAYDRLLIATGARPKLPTIPGLDADSLYVLRTALDARELKTTAEKARRVVVLGGGMVGIKTASALRHLPDPPEVTLVEQEDHILPLRLDSEGAGIVQAALESDGIRIITNTAVRKAIRKPGRAAALFLTGNLKLAADLIIAAIGVRPNTEFLKGSGITVRSGGVLVDDRLRTAARDVYAAGDVAECRDAVTGRSFVSALWTNAAEMGRLAGLNMAGGKDRSHDFFPVMNAAEIAGIPMISAGIVEQGKNYEFGVNRENGIYRKIVMQGAKVVGMSFLGDIRNAGMYVNMIKNRIPVTRAGDKFLRGTATYADVAAGRETA